MTAKLRPQKLADVTYTDAQGRERKRFTVRRLRTRWEIRAHKRDSAYWEANPVYVAYDNTERTYVIRGLAAYVSSGARSRDVVREFLKSVSVSRYERVLVREVLQKLDRQ